MFVLLVGVMRARGSWHGSIPRDDVVLDSEGSLTIQSSKLVPRVRARCALYYKCCLQTHFNTLRLLASPSRSLALSISLHFSIKSDDGREITDQTLSCRNHATSRLAVLRNVTIWKSVKFYNFNNQICLERMS